jgi:hypothetical protein
MNAKAKKFETRLTVSLTGQDYDALNVLADKDEVSASWLVRRAVEEYLRQRHSQPESLGLLRPPGAGRPARRPHVRHTPPGATE